MHILINHILINLGIVIVTVALMEGVAKYSHKYIMHGWGWGWHESHHTEHDDAFERNDLYAVVFAIPSMLLSSPQRWSSSRRCR